MEIGKLYPLSSRVAIMETPSGFTLTDGRRFHGEYSSLSEALADKATFWKLFHGEEL